MGRLGLNKKFYKNISVLANIDSDVYVFLGGSNNTIGTFFNSSELTGNNSISLADRISIFEAGAFTTYFLRADGVTWRIVGSISNFSTLVINNGTIFVVNSASNKTFTMQGTNLIQKSSIFSNFAKISIKKQNLSILKPANTNPDAVYVFKSATTNLLGTIFNQAQFEPFGDLLTIYTEGSLTGANSNFYTDGSTWVYDDYSTNADAYVIPANSILVFSTNNDLNISIGGGAIIQKYYSGKLNLN